MARTLKLRGSDWRVVFDDSQGDEIENFVIERENGKNFHITMVDEGYRQPLIIEHDQGRDRAGDVVIQFRRHPRTGRFMVLTDEENVFETETEIHRIVRAIRSSMDNEDQAVKRRLVDSGSMYTNARRIGGKSVKTWYAVVGWSPELSEHMVDVFDYVRFTQDGPGHSAFLKALAHMEAEPALLIFQQMRMPPTEDNN